MTMFDRLGVVVRQQGFVLSQALALKFLAERTPNLYMLYVAGWRAGYTVNGFKVPEVKRRS